MASPSTSQATRPRAQSLLPTFEELALFLGVPYRPLLSFEKINSLRKPLPGYFVFLERCAQLLVQDGPVLHLDDITPESLNELGLRREHLAQCEELLIRMHASVRQQRMLVDDQAMGALQKIARRVVFFSKEVPALAYRWTDLLRYLKKFRFTGRRAPKPKPQDSVPPANSSGAQPGATKKQPAQERRSKKTRSG